MEILQHGYHDREELKATIRGYNECVQVGIVSPQLVEELYLETYGPEDRLAIARNGNKITGLLEYKILQEKPEKIEGIFAERMLELMGLVWEPESIATIENIESFERGTGTRLINFLKSQLGIKGIYLKSVLDFDVKGFYEKMGFEDTGFKIWKRFLMVWKRSEIT